MKENGTCNVNNFKKAYAVYGKYQKGADKKLSDFTVSAPKIVKPNANGNCIVTIIACGKKATVSIPVKKTTPTPPVDVDPPTEVDWLYYYFNGYDINTYLKNTATVYIAIDLPEGYTSVEEFGCIYTTYNIADSSFVDRHREVKKTISEFTNRTQKLSTYLTLNKDDWDSHATVKVRVYAKVTKDNKQMEVYSKVLTFKLE